MLIDLEMNDYQHANRSSSSSYVLHRKLAIIGDRHVGKSSLAEQFVSGRFIENYDPTIENTLRKSIGFRGTLLNSVRHIFYLIRPFRKVWCING